MNFDWLGQLAHIANENPRLAAGFVGVLLSMMATQFLKFMIPDSVKDSEYRFMVRCIGILSGWFFGYGAWKIFDPTDRAFTDFYWAVGVGFISPAAYSVINAWAIKKWPWLDKVLSGRPNDGSP